MKKRRVAVIGATGSIGKQAVDVIERNIEMFDTVLLTANINKPAMEDAGRRLSAKKTLLTNNQTGELVKILEDIEIDIAVIGASGASMIMPAYILVSRGVTLALANKECIVSAGRQITSAADANNALIIPVDSEHSAIFQCLKGNRRKDITKLILTASGGTFRDLPVHALANVTPAQALNHPNWKMGHKITVDSATMMNKGLELIEARFLFNMPPDRLEVVMHPQSIIHAMVSYLDGSVMAQMSLPDMKTPISYALGYPERIESGAGQLDFTKIMNLEFYPPDKKRYPCLDIALKVLYNDSSSNMIVMNAANEIAVNAFLREELAFNAIAPLIEKILEKADFSEPKGIEDVLEIDRHTRESAQALLRINQPE
ncbi:MAG: 1-deoxy-D-xylulose-5-phosphate reductoisomerase [Deferribacteraceae bacterium]|nr:1-deoxy-D-xylulose-5-phosphate reductoisomerase [Deferribacteraceae bacterium]